MPNTSPSHVGRKEEKGGGSLKDRGVLKGASSVSGEHLWGVSPPWRRLDRKTF